VEPREAIYTLDGTHTQARTERMFQQFVEHLENRDENTIDKGYFDSPEGFDLLIGAVDASNKTRSDGKRDLIARTLAGAASHDSERSEYDPEEYLNVLAILTVRELQVARTIYELQKGLDYKEIDTEKRWETWLAHRDEIMERIAVDEDELALILERIVATGLITLVYIQFPGSPGRTYWVTPAFDRLMKFLQLEA
jgi:hypothetical protein